MAPNIIYKVNDSKTIQLIEKGVPISTLEKRMEHSRDMPTNMLGKGESLVNRIVEDNKILQELGISYDKIASKLDEVFKMKGNVSILDRGYLVILEMTCGSSRCPWEDGALEGAFYTMLFDTDNKEHRLFLEEWKRNGIAFNEEFKNMFTGEPVIIASGLMPHLIREHHFFEGKETPYRCDPRQLAKYLGITPKVE